MDNLELLVKYIEKNLISKDNFNLYMKQCPNCFFQYINNELVDKNSKNTLDFQRRLIAAQVVKNNLINNELNSLAKYNIDWIGIKGIFLQKLYYPPSLIRIFSDIDIQVDPKKGLRFYQLLKENGYKMKTSPKSAFIYQKKLFLDMLLIRLGSISFKRRHHFELVKNVGLENQKLYMDLHGNLFLRKNSPINKMLSEATEKNIDGNKIKVFSPEDNIIFLIFHAIKHIGYIDLADTSFGVNLQHFYDIVQIISKEEIDWNKFVFRAKEYDYLIPMILLFIKMFNDIFPDRIPHFVFVKLNQIVNDLNFYWKPIFKQAIKMNASDLIVGNYKIEPFINEFSEKLHNSNIDNNYTWVLWAVFYLRLYLKKSDRKFFINNILGRKTYD